MNAFSIRDIENLCGIKAHTLRIWEQRYQLLCPRRKAGNHRSYDNDDLKYLLRIAFLYHHGHKVSRLARLSESELVQLALRVPQQDNAHEIFINHLLEAAIDFDQEGFDRILHNIILHMGFDKAISDVVYPFLDKIGLLWLTGNIIPAQEHFASGLIIKRLHVAIDGLDNPPPPSPGSRIILLYTPAGEFHEIPILYMRYRLKKHGIPTIYFGAHVSIGALRQYCAANNVTQLYFHLVTNLLRSHPEQYLRQLTDDFPDTDIVISGAICKNIRGDWPRLRLLRTTEEMEAFSRGR